MPKIPNMVDFFGHPSAARVPAMKPRDGMRFVLLLNQYVMARELAAKTGAPIFALWMRTWCDLHHKSFS